MAWRSYNNNWQCNNNNNNNNNQYHSREYTTAKRREDGNVYDGQRFRNTISYNQQNTRQQQYNNNNNNNVDLCNLLAILQKVGTVQNDNRQLANYQQQPIEYRANNTLPVQRRQDFKLMNMPLSKLIGSSSGGGGLKKKRKRNKSNIEERLVTRRKKKRRKLDGMKKDIDEKKKTRIDNVDSVNDNNNDTFDFKYTHIVLDTNCFIQHHTKILELQFYHNLKSIIPYHVIMELDNLKKSPNRNCKLFSHLALKFIEEQMNEKQDNQWIVRHSRFDCFQSESSLVKKSSMYNGRQNYDNNDDRILDCLMYFDRYDDSVKRVCMVSDDNGLRLKTKMNGYDAYKTDDFFGKILPARSEGQPIYFFFKDQQETQTLEKIINIGQCDEKLIHQVFEICFPHCSTNDVINLSMLNRKWHKMFSGHSQSSCKFWSRCLTIKCWGSEYLKLGKTINDKEEEDDNYMSFGVYKNPVHWYRQQVKKYMPL